MITEVAYGDVSARCQGCPRDEVRRRYDGVRSAEHMWLLLSNEGWWRTDYEYRTWGDTYRLWCPACWDKVKNSPAYDFRTNRISKETS